MYRKGVDVVGMRVLGRVRLSKSTDESTSVERQREACEAWAKAHGHEIVGWAVDLDVSGSVDPMEAPELKPWLTQEGLAKWDIIVAWKLDRFARRVIPLNNLFGLCLDNGKALVSVSESIDLSTWVGRLVANVLAGVAEGELEAIKERVKSSMAYLLKSGRWRGGTPPYGYVSTDNPDGKGRVLVIDPEAQEILEEIAKRVLDGETLHVISDDLNQRGVMPQRDRMRVQAGKPAKGDRWSPSTLYRTMTSPALGGQIRSGDGVIRDDSAAPVVRAEPLLDEETRRRVSRELESRRMGPQAAPRSSNSLLLQVARCRCGQPMYRMKGYGNRAEAYKCGSYRDKTRTCTTGQVPAQELYELVEGVLLTLVGGRERMERVWSPGSDTAAELERVESELVDLVGQLGLPAYKPGTPQRQALDARIAALASRQDVLAATPTREPGWSFQATGELFSEWWAAQDVKDRNRWLRDYGVSLVWHGRGQTPETELEFGDVHSMIEAVSGTRAA